MRNVHYEELPLSDLIISEYNRPIKKEVANKWSRHFDMKLIGTITVSHRDGNYYIIDGQHRTQAAIRKGIKTLPCLIHEGLTYQEEAEMFVKLNKERRGLLVVDLFKGECEAGDIKALELKAAIENAGYCIGKGSGTMRVYAIRTLQKIFSTDGEYMIKDILTIVHDAWGGIRTANNRLILLGLWRFLQVYQYEHGRDRLVSVLAKTPPAVIVRSVRGDLSDKSDTSKAAMSILSIYNKGLRKKLVNRFE